MGNSVTPGLGNYLTLPALKLGNSMTLGVGNSVTLAALKLGNSMTAHTNVWRDRDGQITWMRLTGQAAESFA